MGAMSHIWEHVTRIGMSHTHMGYVTRMGTSHTHIWGMSHVWGMCHIWDMYHMWDICNKWDMYRTKKTRCSKYFGFSNSKEETA
jgi:hypothetical protein